MKNLFRSDWFILLLFLLLGAGLGSYYMFEVKWDWANYHYYNPWAFLNNRVGYDIAPASINTYFNPLIDLPYYFMVQYLNDYPKLVSALQGTYYGVMLFFIYKIARMFWGDDSWKSIVKVGLVLMIAGTGFTSFSQIATTSNGMQISILVLSALYILFKTIGQPQKNKNIPFGLSGLILGIALGLKLTAIIYCASTGILLIMLHKSLNISWRQIVIFTICGLVGFLIINGFWMITLWEHFQNPFFPFANGIFKSEYMEAFNFRDDRYIPQTILRWLFFPFYWMIHYQRVVAETVFVDFRFALMYLVVLIYAISFWVKKKKSDAKFKFLYCFIIISYLIWLFLFSIIRYLQPVEALGALLLVKFSEDFHPQKSLGQILYYTMLLILLYMLLSTPAEIVEWGTRREDKKVVEMEDLNIKDGTLVLLYNMPMAAVVPELSKKAKDIRVIGLKQFNMVKMRGTDLTESGKFLSQRNEIIKNHSGDILAFVRTIPIYSPTVEFYMDDILKKMKCRSLKTNIDELIEVCFSKEKKE